MIIFSLIKIQSKIFINNFAKINSIIKIIYIFVLIYILFNYNQTSKLLIEYIKIHFNKDDRQFYVIANILLFVIFFTNLFSVFFLSIGRTLSNHLKFFPISYRKIVIYEILVGIFDISNLLFVGIYFAVYFIFYNTLFTVSFLKFFFLFILFILLISNISFFIKSLVQYYFVFNRKKKVFQIITIILFVVLLKYLIALNISDLNLLKLSGVLNYSPSGKYLQLLFNTQASLPIIIKISFYFLFLNVLFFVVNISFTKKLLRINYSNSIGTNTSKTNLSLLQLFTKLKINPLQKKEILYHLRSYKMSINFLFIILLYPIFLCLIIFRGDFGNGKELLLILKNIGLLSQLFIIVTLSGNIFRFGSQDTKTSFLLPISSTNLIASKASITYLLLSMNYFYISIGLFYSRISFFNYLFFIALLLITFYSFHYFAIFLSIYFPKELNMNALNGLNISLVTLLVFLPLMLIVFLLVQYTLGLSVLLYKILIILFSLALPVLLPKLQIINYLAMKLNKQKNKLITGM